MPARCSWTSQKASHGTADLAQGNGYQQAGGGLSGMHVCATCGRHSGQNGPRKQAGQSPKWHQQKGRRQEPLHTPADNRGHPNSEHWRRLHLSAELPWAPSAVRGVFWPRHARPSPKPAWITALRPSTTEK